MSNRKNLGAWLPVRLELPAKLILALCIILIPAVASAAMSWDIVREDGRDYVTLQNVSDFYGFGTVIPPASTVAPDAPDTPLTRTLVLMNGDRRLEVTTNSRTIVANGAKQWLSFPVLIKDEKILISRLDLAKALEPALRPQAIPGYKPVKTVVLDAGHGGHDKGAHSPYGYEKNFALDVARRAKGLLEAKGIEVVMTRDDDEFIPLHTRAKIGNKYEGENAIFVSIHFNSSLENRLASGFEVFSCTPRGGPSTSDKTLSRRDLASENGNANDVLSAVLATSVHNAAIGTIPVVDRGVKDARFAVLRLSKLPAILFEGGFVSNAEESKNIASDEWRQRLAEAIVQGVAEYKKVAETRTPPKIVAEYRRETNTRVTLRDLAPTVITSADASAGAGPTVTVPTTR